MPEGYDKNMKYFQSLSWNKLKINHVCKTSSEWTTKEVILRKALADGRGKRGTEI
jgi:hypothetical protein